MRKRRQHTLADVWNSCLRKFRHHTLASVKEAARHESKRSKICLSWYKCRHCGGYHLTSWVK